MVLIPIELVDCGVDWVTLTAPSHDTGIRLALDAEILLRDEERRGNILRTWSMSGYEGFKCGSVAAGTRHDSSIIRLGGPLAQQHWREFYGTATNCSRLDLQATYRFEKEARSVIATAFRGVLNHRRRFKRGPTISMWREVAGSATLYFGKRSSERFARVYDKGVESGLDHYERCVRFEIELKGNTAWSTFNALARTPATDFSLKVLSPELKLAHGLVAEYFRSQGVSLEWATVCESLLRSAPALTDLSQSLEWLQRQVAPTIAELLKLGHSAVVLDALFGEHTEHMDHRIKSACKDGPVHLLAAEQKAS